MNARRKSLSSFKWNCTSMFSYMNIIMCTCTWQSIWIDSNLIVSVNPFDEAKRRNRDSGSPSISIELWKVTTIAIIIWSKPQLMIYTYALPIFRLFLLCDFSLLHLLRLSQLILCRLIQVAWFDLDKLQRIAGWFRGRRFGYTLLRHIFRGIEGGCCCRLGWNEK